MNLRTARRRLPPANFLHEVKKIERRWPVGIAYVRDHRLNKWLGPDQARGVGSIVHSDILSLNIPCRQRGDGMSI